MPSNDSRPPSEQPETSTFQIPGQEQPTDHIGPYRLLEVLGEGGMGTVYLAEQRGPVHRKVALKIIKLGMGTKEVIGRFESERQALAMMNHPNIAQVHDAGATEAGRPYFVMEHVAGVPITDYCDRHRLSTRERLELFIPVCRAIHHAHQKGVIHRDIKPSNVLVAVQDGKPVAKVIDFGVAKAIEKRLTEKTVFTEQGRMIGTPEYMSPEQAEMTGLNIDTTSDVYSLGVLLYELLTGTLPFDRETFLEVGWLEIHRIIREVDPPKPSTRISSLGERAALPAGKRRTIPPTWLRQIRGELDWITMRAMEKDRTRRYLSASEFAADIERYLHNEAVMAGPPSFGYRFRKLVARHRTAVLASSAVVLALVIGAAVSVGFGLKAESRRLEAEALRLEAEEQRQNAIWQSYVASMSAASANFRLRDIAIAKRQLAACPAELCGWEWFYLSRKIDRSEATLLRNDAWMTAVAYSPDGKRIAAASNDKTVRVLDAASGKLLATMLGHEHYVTCVAFGPDGKRIASGSADGTVRLWDTASGEPLMTLPEQDDWISCIAFSPDGTCIASAHDNTVRLWDATSGALQSTLRGHDDYVLSVSFSPDGKQLVSGSYDVTVRLWDVVSSTLKKTMRGHDEPVGSVSFSPDGKRIVSGSYDGTIRLWDATSGTMQETLQGPGSDISTVAFSPDGARIASGSEDKAIRLWDAASGELQLTLWGHDAAVWSVAFSPDGTRIASASSDRTIRLWDTALVACPAILRGHEGRVASVAFSPDGRRIVSGSYDKTVRLWDAVSYKLTATLTGHAGHIFSVAYSPDGRRVASASGDSTVRVWDADSGDLLTTAVGQDVMHSVTFSQDGTRIVTGSWDGSVRLWDAQSGDQIEILQEHEAAVYSVAISPDGTCVASGGDDGTVKLWDFTKGQLRATHVHGGEMLWVSFNPNGESYVVASPREAEAKLCNVDSGELLAVLAGHEGGVMWTTFNPAGTRIATASLDGVLRIWDAVTAELLATFAENDDEASIVFSPDGRFIASAGFDDNAIHVWDGTPNRTRENAVKFSKSLLSAPGR